MCPETYTPPVLVLAKMHCVVGNFVLIDKDYYFFSSKAVAETAKTTSFISLLKF